MSTPKTTTPISTTTPQPPESISVATITALGADLTRLIVALIPLSVRAVETISTNLSQTLSADGTASPQAGDDLGTAASNLIGAASRLSLGLITTAARSLDAVTRAVGADTTGSGNPPRA